MLAKANTTKILSHEELERKTLAEWDGRGMKIRCVANMELNFRFHVIAHKVYSSSCLKNVSCEAVDLPLKVVKNMSFNHAEKMLNQFNKNMERIRNSNNNPSKDIVVWRKDVPILYQINEYIVEMGKNYVNIMDNYFDSFKENMNKNFRIPKKLVEDYKDDVCFMVDYDKVYIQAVKPRVVWVKPLAYEVNIDDTRDIIKAFLNEPMDPKV